MRKYFARDVFMTFTKQDLQGGREGNINLMQYVRTVLGGIECNFYYRYYLIRSSIPEQKG